MVSLPVDFAVSGDNAVTGDFLVFHTEIGAPVGHEYTQLLKRPRIEENVYPLARR